MLFIQRDSYEKKIEKPRKGKWKIRKRTHWILYNKRVDNRILSHKTICMQIQFRSQGSLLIFNSMAYIAESDTLTLKNNRRLYWY